jgi:hypothetical protein
LPSLAISKLKDLKDELRSAGWPQTGDKAANYHRVEALRRGDPKPTTTKGGRTQTRSTSAAGTISQPTVLAGLNTHCLSLDQFDEASNADDTRRSFVQIGKLVDEFVGKNDCNPELATLKQQSDEYINGTVFVKTKRAMHLANVPEELLLHELVLYFAVSLQMCAFTSEDVSERYSWLARSRPELLDELPLARFRSIHKHLTCLEPHVDVSKAEAEEWTPSQLTVHEVKEVEDILNKLIRTVRNAGSVFTLDDNVEKVCVKCKSCASA